MCIPGIFTLGYQKVKYKCTQYNDHVYYIHPMVEKQFSAIYTQRKKDLSVNTFTTISNLIGQKLRALV
jgi:hypothetical protein